MTTGRPAARPSPTPPRLAGVPLPTRTEGPRHPHGFLDATTDPDKITEWWSASPDRNVAIATGAPGPDVLDVDVHSPDGNGFAALGRLHRAGLLDGADGLRPHPQRRPARLLPGTEQRSGTCPATMSTSGPRAATCSRRPPSQRPALPAWSSHRRARQARLGRVHQAAAARRSSTASEPSPAPDHREPWRAGSARQPEGNRNDGLFWAANRALEADPAADLNPLADAARPGRPRRPGNQQDPGLRPPDRPDPARTARSPGRGGELKMSINPQAGPVPGHAGPPYPAGGPARAHVRRLRQDGGTYRGIAAAAGLAPATVSDLDRGRRRPNRGTTAAVLAVISTSVPRGRVDAGGTRLRLRALPVMGHGSARVARAVGVSEMPSSGSSAATRTQSARGCATRSRPLRRLVGQARTRAHPLDHAAATAARRRAIRGNWCAGAALDDDVLDTPGYRPAQGWRPARGTSIAADIQPAARE